ncbi:hypothetical protein MBLNU459_g6954t1 [Dothideomycetes sp. NU459]
MAKTKSKAGSKSPAQRPQESPEQLYEQALELLETSQPDLALDVGQRLLKLVQSSTSAPQPALALPALNLLGDINIELGDADAARAYFLQAIAADPDGAVPEALGGGCEKFLWLAQLCEQGGQESVAWFEKGVAVLKREIAELEAQTSNPSSSSPRDEDAEALLEERKAKLANALCGVVEVYMTDLSWEPDAEARCESLITEALFFAPENPEVLQTLASIRLSQVKLDDARSALTRSLSVWKDLDPEDPSVPDFPSRIALARLLMEAEMEDEAMEVLERLALEDDQSVEACYLGGWCARLLADKKKTQAQNGAAASAPSEEVLATLKVSRSWLLNTLKLYQLLDYEDERLKEHTLELVAELNDVLGPPPEEGKEEEEEEWEGIEEDETSDGEDHEMTG